MVETLGWTPAPDSGGTLNILWTWLATMALCVWTAVHPNIPLVYSFWTSFLERLRLMFLVIIFPEFILTSAWEERRQANALFLEVKTLLEHSTSDVTLDYSSLPYMPQSPAHRRAADGNDLTPLVQATGPDHPLHTRFSSEFRDEHRGLPPWSFEHAIFGIMGGFATETQQIDEAGQKHVLRRILTPQAISILAKAGRLPIIESQEIEERSKADVFAKAAVVGQCLWFALQVIGRLFQGLSVTPLETHTAIHKKRIIDSTQGTTTFRPPPARPIPKSITELLDESQQPVGYISDEKSKTLPAIAADALEGLQLLEQHSCYDFRRDTLGRLNLVREGSQGLTVRRVWGGWSTDVRVPKMPFMRCSTSCTVVYTC
ncbi:hypothetical protein BJX68DRAFT_272582 [Aspergillus pseudodeflectus]|uniref:Uncharacterized protein n=1 Tax=Aspergillus pseudodeflectus TaxID=176178 RepID=A0ABR4JEP5_9EURO